MVPNCVSSMSKWQTNGVLLHYIFGSVSFMQILGRTNSVFWDPVLPMAASRGQEVDFRINEQRKIYKWQYPLIIVPREIVFDKTSMALDQAKVIQVEMNDMGDIIIPLLYFSLHSVLRNNNSNKTKKKR